MNNKLFQSWDLMSGTSMDGVDASIIQSNGNSMNIRPIFNEYFAI